jgi:hypothetical protein
MKITVVNRRETGRIRHFLLDLKVEHDGKTYDLSVILIENCEMPCSSPVYEIESIEWSVDTESVDTADIEKKVEGYLIDTAEEILRAQ